MILEIRPLTFQDSKISFSLRHSHVAVMSVWAPLPIPSQPSPHSCIPFHGLLLLSPVPLPSPTVFYLTLSPSKFSLPQFLSFNKEYRITYNTQIKQLHCCFCKGSKLGKTSKQSCLIFLAQTEH